MLALCTKKVKTQTLSHTPLSTPRNPLQRMSIWIPQKLASIIRIIVSLNVCKGLGQGQQLDVVYTNHEKACDHLDHRISLDKSGILKYKTFSNKIFVFG